MIRHYIRLINSFIVHGFSSCFEDPIDGDICISEDAPRHFQLLGIYNPRLKDHEGFSLYKYVNGEVLPATQEEQPQWVSTQLVKLEQAVDMMIDKECQSRGYRNADSIGKYLGYDNEFRTECEILGAWISSCYEKCYELLSVGEMLTVDELLAQMPEIVEG